MKKKISRAVAKKSTPVRHHHSFSSHPKHLGQMEMLLLVVAIIILIGIVGSITGTLPSFWGYPRVLSAMVGR